jgi:RNA polymerase sigma-70 factor (ECF subfamily)
MLMSLKDPPNTQDRFIQFGQSVAWQSQGLWESAELRRGCLRLARRYAVDADDADDIAQEAMLRAWRHRSSLRADEQFWGWLARIVHNEAVRIHTRPVPEPVAEIRESAEVRDEAALIERLDVQSAVADLSPAEREMVCLRYLADLTQPAIARVLGLPEGTVKVRLHRARAKLHRTLSDS